VAEAKAAQAAAQAAAAAHVAAAATARRDALASRQAAREADRARDRLEVEEVKMAKQIAVAKVRKEGFILFCRACRCDWEWWVVVCFDLQMGRVLLSMTRDAHAPRAGYVGGRRRPRRRRRRPSATRRRS